MQKSDNPTTISCATDIVGELRRLAGHDPLCIRAAEVIERLRAAFIEDCELCGYTENDTAKMLAEVENGTAR